MLDGLEHKPAAAHAASRGTEPLPPIKEPGQHRTRWKARLGHDLRRSFHFSVIFLILVGLAACGSGGAADPGTRDPGPPDTDPADELPTVLKPGGTFLDETGGVISALQGALEEAVRVSVDLIDAPEEALPESAIAAGPHYLVRSEVDTVADEAPFLLALPVPADADPERLALALLIEPVDIEGMDLEGNAMWEFLPSLYDPDGQYLAAAVWELAESGRAIVLIESDEVEPPLVSEPPAGDADRLTAQANVATFFDVKCSGFKSSKNNNGYTCGAAEQNALAAELKSAHSLYTQLGFAEPRLTSIFAPGSWFRFGVGLSQNTGIFFTRTYPVKLRPYWDVGPKDKMDTCGRDGSKTYDGAYYRTTATLVVCIDDKGIRDYTRLTARHEYFHATQYSYKRVRQTRNHTKGPSWVLEATATAASASTNGMARESTRWLRAVDIPLDSNKDFAEYKTQDFFVYAARRLDRDLDYLISVLEHGLRTRDVHDALQSLGLNGGLPELYWDWATNQAFEARMDNGNPATRPQCSFSAATATPADIDFTGTGESSESLTIGPLTSRVVSVTFEPLRTSAYSAIAVVDAMPSANVKSKFYEDSWRGGTSCHSHPEARTHAVTVEPGKPTTLHLLISNTSMTRSADVTVRVGQQLTIVSPTPGMEFEEADDIEFRAIAASAEGGRPDRFRIEWLYERRADGPLMFASSGSNEPVSRSFCDGIHTVTAIATHRDTGEKMEASVTFTVIDSDPPPARCAPDVSITSPLAGATYALGESVTFTANFEDDHPETPDPVHPLVWRLGGPEGTKLHEGSAEFTTSALPEGEHTVHVQYGIASDTVNIRVIDTPNEPPTATIEFPKDDDQFYWFDFDIEKYLDRPEIEVRGSATDPEDGPLTGDSLDWWVRVGTGGTWRQRATGESFMMRLPWTAPTLQVYYIRLRATDSEGLTGETEIRIFFTRPPS